MIKSNEKPLFLGVIIREFGLSVNNGSPSCGAVVGRFGMSADFCTGIAEINDRQKTPSQFSVR